MPTHPLPAALLAADARLAEVHARYHLAQHLNPLDVEAARHTFLSTGRLPELRYAPLPEADDALAALTAIEVPDDHPLGAVLRDAIGETAAGLRALRDRDEASFHAWNERSGWYPSAEDLAPDPAPPGAGPAPAEAAPVVDPARMRQALVGALRARGWEWEVRFDPVMSARVLVDATHRQVIVNPAARFRPSDLVGLVAHEIDVHVRRAEGGGRQPLRVFATGLPGALCTEEGLAVLAEERVGTLAPTARAGHRLLAMGVDVAREAGFEDLYGWMRERAGPASAWTATLRLKRGLADPGAPGVYAKDSVYWVGGQRVRRWTGDLAALFVGKVGLEHPVGAWVREGWLTPPDPPPAWLVGA